MGYLPVTLPISGEVVLVQPVSPLLLAKLRKKYPPPEAPSQQVNYGTSEAPQWADEPNESHPDYLKALQEWKLLLEERSRHFAMILGTQIEWTKEKRERLEAYREAITSTGEELDIEEDDKIAYISYVAIQSGEDYATLLKAVLEGSRPTEEGIKDAIASFRADTNGEGTNLQGEGHILYPSAS